VLQQALEARLVASGVTGEQPGEHRLEQAQGSVGAELHPAGQDVPLGLGSVRYEAWPVSHPAGISNPT
jgi:hypothetical protein